MKYEVIGADRLRATLRRAGDDLQDLKDAPAQAAGVVVRAARAPVRTGALASTVRAGGVSGNVATVNAGGGSVRYAGPIHWGWPARGIRAQPFLSIAATSSEPVWIKFYEREIEQAIDKVKGA